MKKLTERTNCDFLTWKQAQALLNVSMVTCRRICAESGAIVRFGSKVVRIDRKRLIDYIGSECTDTPAEQG